MQAFTGAIAVGVANATILKIEAGPNHEAQKNEPKNDAQGQKWPGAFPLAFLYEGIF